jgi:hypothetical protein
MARKGRGSNTSEILVFLLFFFSLSLLSVPLSFLGVEKEVKRGQQIVQKDVGVHKEDRQL